MTRILAMCLDAAIAAVILVPLFLLLNKHYFRNNMRTVFYTLFAVYLSGMFAVVGLPDIRYVRFDPNYNIIPFAYMFSDFTNSALNVLLFFPLGCFLPVFWKRYEKMHSTVLFGLSVSLLIEVLQIFTYRASDINDLMTNTAGTFLGWCFAKIMQRTWIKFIPSENHRELYVICLSAFAVMFFFQPFLANGLVLYFL